MKLKILYISKFIILLFCFQYLKAQNSLLEVKLSNDKFVFQDKYYTNGIHITYRKNLDEDFVFKTKDNQRLQLNLQLGQETYTPSNLWSFDTNDFDRPYAGWLFINAEISKITSNSALFIALETGVTGKASFAGKLQKAFHKALNIMQPTWQDEISDKWLVNLKAKKVFDIKSNSWSSFQNHTSASLGSKDTFIENKVMLFLGKFNKLQDSYRLNAFNIESEKEYFGFLGLGYRYVWLNTLIQGSPFNDNDIFTSIAEPHILYTQIGGVLKAKQKIFKLEFNYNSKETPLATSHIFGAFTLGFLF